jgi:thiopeptide-type bacteriocin biosynthesis protein
MPADHLTTDSETSLSALEHAVLAVLTGTPAAEAAARHPSLSAGEVIRAAQRYQAAGRTALSSVADSGWYQVNIEFPDPGSAERTLATHLLPPLQRAHADGTVGTWWYIRKTPHWRLRLSASHRAGLLPQAITAALDDLSAQHLITTWSEGVYEPETHAFGGPEAMHAAHRFFHRDSVNVLSYLDSSGCQLTPAVTPFPLRELSLLTCAALLRAAGQDWHEQGDVWHRVAQTRPLGPATPHDRLRHLTGQLHHLFAADLERVLTNQGLRSPFDTVRPWFAAATEAGDTLRYLAGLGRLRRGLRDVLAHHVIFHWNRLGLTTPQQAILAHAAAITILPPSAGGTSHDLAVAVDVART